LAKDTNKETGEKKTEQVKTTVKKVAKKNDSPVVPAIEAKAKKTAAGKAVTTTPAKKTARKVAAEKTAIKKSVTDRLHIDATHNQPVTDRLPINKPAKKTGVKKTDLKKTAVKKKAAGILQKIIFQLRFHTQFGQEIFITGDHDLLGNNDAEQAVPLQYFNDEYWYLALDIAEPVQRKVTYHYILRNAGGIDDHDFGNDKTIDLSQATTKELLVIDTWNYTGYVENAFYTKPFAEVLLAANHTPVKTTTPSITTHVLKVKAPLLAKGQTICLLGSCDALSNWNTSAPLLMQRMEGETFFSIAVDLSETSFPIAYKFGVYDVAENAFVCYEGGDNRVLFDTVSSNRQTILHDGFAALPNTMWKGAGIAVPVFGLRSEKSFGTGEFSDLIALVDWIKLTGIRMIQVLPVNDTTATNTWMDSYPYSAISAFALHPLYISLEKLADGGFAKQLQQLEKERLRLEALPALDYEAVTKIKRTFVAAVYKENGKQVFQTASYKTYFENNRHWLIPYAAYSHLRDEYDTVDFNQWPAHDTYNESEIKKLVDAHPVEIGLFYFTQYHLHQQLKEATAYARANGIVVKGDIPIGVSRSSADAWQDPTLYNMDYQAGAPPDDFAVKGQNWGFPTYNWQRMREDGFAWWKKRFAQMNDYFDAFRIDHILGFFRIWSIPLDAVEGIMGHFVPAIPVHINEFNSRAVWFDQVRYTRPFINETVLREVFGDDGELVKSMFLQKGEADDYSLRPAFDTQRKVEHHFAKLDNDEQHARIRTGLYDLISNVILFEAENTNGQSYHFRFNMEHTSSYRHLGEETQQQLKELYINYFFRRQDDLWRKEALQKLPGLKRATNMLVCGEDLGLIPACVPEVMKQSGLLSLEIQRMPKDDSHEFFHPNEAPYLSVVTPATHDMSTIRGWWEEDKERTQRFYNRQLGQPGEAPAHCDISTSKAIILQHLYSPAMWCIFQLQDLLGMDETLRRADVASERINVPADPKHYWQYRMHVGLEKLKEAKEFNVQVLKFVFASGR
jgi:4-alpha-glucanotransferase